MRSMKSLIAVCEGEGLENTREARLEEPLF